MLAGNINIDNKIFDFLIEDSSIIKIKKPLKRGF